MENYIVINGKKANLTPEQLEALGIEVKKENPFGMGAEGERYYYITSWGHTMEANMCKENNSDLRWHAANYCTNEPLLLQQAYRETLNRLLWRFSMEHDGGKIGWNGDEEYKYYLYYSHIDKAWHLDWNRHNQLVGACYFESNEIAQQAIEEIVKPFMAAHPNFQL